MQTRIAHTTDLSPASVTSFLHALRLAVAARARLDILHVKAPGSSDAWIQFPHVRDPLIRWNLLPPTATPADIDAKLGVQVAKIEITDRDPRHGLASFLHAHRPDLLVVATHGREGLNRWISGSVTESVIERTHLPTLMIGPESRGFVHPGTGQIVLKRIFMPVVPEPNPAQSVLSLIHLLGPCGVTGADIDLVTIGGECPDVLDPSGRPIRVETLDGPVADTILGHAAARHADLIVMPTTGRHGLIDAFRGSTTRRVLPQAPCPLLTIPMVAQ